MLSVERNQALSAPDPVFLRKTVHLDPVSVLDLLRAMGRTLIGVRAGGALLERIGVFEGAVEQDGLAVGRGAAHETSVEIAAVASVVSDRSPNASGKVSPNITLLDAAGEPILRVTALDGLEAFDAALAGVEESPIGPAMPKEKPETPASESDPGFIALRQIADAGAKATLEVARPGATQSWTGLITELRLGQNFVNIIQPEVHLHLRAGSVATWRREESGAEVLLHAVDAKGADVGLTIAAAAEAVPQA